MKILISGDFCPIRRNAQIIEKEEYSSLFNGFEKIIANVDYAIVNFECPVTSSSAKNNKTGPCIKTENLNSLVALKYAGFNALTLANNHIQDYSGEGVKDTITHAKNAGFETVGAGKNRLESAKPLIIQVKNHKIGIINIAENEFCAATDDMPGAYTFDFIENSQTINNLKGKVDKIILIYHGGREHYQLPTPDQRKKFRYFIDLGVDAIVAHHTHCVSGYEYYNNKPIVYSLGNFIFDYKKKYQKGNWTEGMSVILNLVSDSFKIELIPHRQGRKNDSTLQLLHGIEKEEFLKRVDNLNEIITNDVIFFQEWKEYLKTQEAFYLSSIYIKNIYFRFLFMKGILPKSWLRSKHNILLLNLMRCEAHHEISKGLLNNSIKNR